MNFWDSANEGVNSGIKLGVKYAKKNKKKREAEQFSQEEENEDALMSQANDQVQRENAKLGTDTNLYEEEEEEPKKRKSGLNPSTAYKIYQKYAGNGSAMAGRSEGMIEMTPAESAAAGGESGGMGGLGSVLAIIYGADQIKKQFGGYNRKESELKLDENSHYYWTKPEINEIPWEEKTTVQKATDAPGGVGAVGGSPIMHVLGLTSDEDSAIGKYYKEMSRMEELAFSPISKIISWLGLDVNQEGQEE